MEKEKIFASFIEVAIGKKIEVVLTTSNISGLNPYAELDPSGIIVKLEVNKIIMSDHDRTAMSVFPYLTSFQRTIWENLAGKLFTILHEIGHIKTLVGLNQTEYFQAKENLSSNCYISEDEINRRYRQLEVERKADEWATQWVLDNPETASYYSDLIESAYR